jgi:hypothetical protein
MNYSDHPSACLTLFRAVKRIIDRLARLTQDWTFSGYYFVSSDDAKPDVETQVSRVDVYRNRLADFGENEGEKEEAARLRAAPIATTQDKVAFEAMTKDRNLMCSELPNLYRDLEAELMEKRDPRLFGVHAAILELTKRPVITSWIMEDSVSLSIDLEPVYLFSKMVEKCFWRGM